MLAPARNCTIHSLGDTSPSMMVVGEVAMNPTHANWPFYKDTMKLKAQLNLPPHFKHTEQICKTRRTAVAGHRPMLVAEVETMVGD